MQIKDETYKLVRDALLNMQMFDTPVARGKINDDLSEGARETLRKAIDALAEDDPEVKKYVSRY